VRAEHWPIHVTVFVLGVGTDFVNQFIYFPMIMFPCCKEQLLICELHWAPHTREYIPMESVRDFLNSSN